MADFARGSRGNWRACLGCWCSRHADAVQRPGRTCDSDCHDCIRDWPARPSCWGLPPGSSSRSELWLKAARPEDCALHVTTYKSVMISNTEQGIIGEHCWCSVCSSSNWVLLLRGRSRRSSVFGTESSATHGVKKVQSISNSLHLGVGMLIGFEWLGLGLVLSRPNTHDPDRRPSVCISRSSARDCSWPDEQLLRMPPLKVRLLPMFKLRKPGGGRLMTAFLCASRSAADNGLAGTFRGLGLWPSEKLGEW